MHHADTELTGLSRRGDSPHYTVHPHVACVTPDQTIGDVHQRRFAGAILAEECVNFSGAEREIGPVQCLDGAESLLDASQLEDRGHPTQSPVG